MGRGGVGWPSIPPTILPPPLPRFPYLCLLNISFPVPRVSRFRAGSPARLCSRSHPPLPRLLPRPRCAAPARGGREGGMQEQRVPACEAGSREPSSAFGRVWERFVCSRCSGPALFSSPREPCLAAGRSPFVLHSYGGTRGAPARCSRRGRLRQEAQSRDVTSKPGPQAAAAAGNQTSPSQQTSPSKIKAPEKFWRAEGSGADTFPTGICAVCIPAKGSDKSWRRLAPRRLFYLLYFPPYGEQHDLTGVIHPSQPAVLWKGSWKCQKH